MLAEGFEIFGQLSDQNRHRRFGRRNIWLFSLIFCIFKTDVGFAFFSLKLTYNGSFKVQLR